MNPHTELIPMVKAFGVGCAVIFVVVTALLFVAQWMQRRRALKDCWRVK